MKPCGKLNIFLALEDRKGKWLGSGICCTFAIFMTLDTKENPGLMTINRGGRKNVKARIDRVVASPCWSDRFKMAQLMHIISSRSDHFPLLLDYEGVPDRRKIPRLFRYEAMWERNETLSVEIEEAWKKNNVPSSGVQGIARK